MLEDLLGPLARRVARAKWVPDLVAGMLVGGAGLSVGALTLWVAFLLLVAGLGIEALKRYGQSLIRDQDADAVAEFTAVLDAALQPLARSLQLLESHRLKKDRMAELTGVLYAVMHGALQSAGAGPGVRASLFQRISEESTDVFVPHPSFSLGRGDQPVSRFVRDEGEGEAVWKAAEDDDVIFYPDIREDAPEGMDLERDRAYCTFITAPIRVNGKVSGLLTINAPRPGDLSDDDAIMMRFLAGLAGLALQMCDGEWPVRGTT